MAVMDHHNMRRFLIALARTRRVRPASADVGISLSTLYKHRRENPSFRRLWADALLRGRALPVEVDEDPLTAEAWHRIFEGTERPVFYQGEQVGTVTDYHDGLLVQMLRMQERRRVRQETLDAASPADQPGELAEILELIDGRTRRLRDGAGRDGRPSLAPEQSLPDPQRRGA